MAVNKRHIKTAWVIVFLASPIYKKDIWRISIQERSNTNKMWPETSNIDRDFQSYLVHQLAATLAISLG